MSEVFAERKFVLEASRDRVWGLLGRAIIDSLEMERFHARDDRNFNALTRVKVSFITIIMQVRGEMTDITPPEFLSVLLEIRALKGMLKLNQKVTFNVVSLDKDRTEITCQVSGSRIGFPLGLFIMPRAISFGGEILQKIERRLKRIA